MSESPIQFQDYDNHETSTPLDRLKYLYKISRRNQIQFARLLGIDPSSLSRLLTGRMPVTRVYIDRCVVNLGVSKEWMETGNGVPFPKNSSPKILSEDDRLIMTETPKGAPVYDIDATAGCQPLSRMFTRENIIGYLDMPQLEPGNPIIRVSGESMTPHIPDGSFISIREIKDISIIVWGAVYLVQLEDYRMVKIIRRHPEDPTKVILHSENPAFDDIEINRSSILKLFLVETIINCRTIA